MISPGLVLKPVVSCRLRSSWPRCHWETTLDLAVSKNYCSPIIAIKQNSPAKRAFPYLLRNSLSENFDNILSNIIVKMPLWHWVCEYKLLQIFTDFVIGQMLPISRLNTEYIFTGKSYKFLCWHSPYQFFFLSNEVVMIFSPLTICLVDCSCPTITFLL